jgi:hypothetical protein
LLRSERQKVRELKYILCQKGLLNGVGPARALEPARLAMSFAIYLIGYVIFIIGLAVGAHLMHVPPRWIGVGLLVLGGLGILKAVSHTRQRDPN